MKRPATVGLVFARIEVLRIPFLLNEISGKGYRLLHFFPLLFEYVQSETEKARRET